MRSVVDVRRPSTLLGTSSYVLCIASCLGCGRPPASSQRFDLSKHVLGRSSIPSAWRAETGPAVALPGLLGHPRGGYSRIDHTWRREARRSPICFHLADLLPQLLSRVAADMVGCYSDIFRSVASRVPSGCQGYSQWALLQIWPVAAVARLAVLSEILPRVATDIRSGLLQIVLAAGCRRFAVGLCTY